MKKLLILMTVAVLLLGAAGCRICDWFRRPTYQQCPPTVMYSSPCTTTVNACDPCSAAPVVTTGP